MPESAASPIGPGLHDTTREVRLEALPACPGLPVFQLVGGSAEQRQRICLELLAALSSRRLLGRLCGPVAELLATGGYSGICRRLRECDLLLVEGDGTAVLIGSTPMVGGEAAKEVDPWYLEIPAEAAHSQPLPTSLVDCLVRYLDQLVRQTPVWGCVLIGGRSSRMGRPKQLLCDESGRSWLESTFALLTPQLAGVVVAGGGKLPDGFAQIPRLADIPGISGPASGLLSAGRWQPMVSWLLVACDMPQISAAAVAWLLAGRRAGCWGLQPRLAGRDRAEPLLAWYDFRAITLLEEQLCHGDWRLGRLSAEPRIATPEIPAELQPSWTNVNTPEELQALHRDR